LAKNKISYLFFYFTMRSFECKPNISKMHFT